jgi:hypothetical protein
MTAPITTMALDPIASFRAEVIERAMAHAQWHIDRAIYRGIEASDVEAAEHLFAAALLALGEAETESDRAVALEAAHASLYDWKGVLESLADGPDNGYTYHCAELDHGELRSLLRCIGGLDHLASAECRATRTREQVLVSLAAELFDCPLSPELEDA